MPAKGTKLQEQKPKKKPASKIELPPGVTLDKGEDGEEEQAPAVVPELAPDPLTDEDRFEIHQEVYDHKGARQITVLRRLSDDRLIYRGYGKRLVDVLGKQAPWSYHVRFEAKNLDEAFDRLNAVVLGWGIEHEDEFREATIKGIHERQQAQRRVVPASAVLGPEGRPAGLRMRGKSRRRRR